MAELSLFPPPRAFGLRNFRVGGRAGQALRPSLAPWDHRSVCISAMATARGISWTANVASTAGLTEVRRALVEM